MPELSILIWNIQNLGEKKTRFPDIMNAIARVVTSVDPDLFIVLEINTTAPGKAAGIAMTLQRTLRKNGRPGEWTRWAVSPGTGLEFYAFFIRDAARVKPLVLPRGTDRVGEVAGLPFTTFEGEGACGFPLVEPVLTRLHQHHEPHWTGTRLPCLGMFAVEGVVLPILAGHCAANLPQAEAQLGVLPCFEIPDAVCNAGGLAIAVDGTPMPVRHVVVTGDFNIHLNPAEFPAGMAVAHGNWTFPHAALPSVAPPAGAGDEPAGGKRSAGLAFMIGERKRQRGLGMRAAIGAPTHLTPVSAFDPREMHSTPELAVNCFDNFFLSDAIALESTLVVDVPAMIRESRALRLRQAVDEYAARGMRNLSAEPYQPPVADYAGQLRRWDPTTISLPAALVGARLISDHLPVAVRITLG